MKDINDFNHIMKFFFFTIEIVILNYMVLIDLFQITELSENVVGNKWEF